MKPTEQDKELREELIDVACEYGRPHEDHCGLNDENVQECTCSVVTLIDAFMQLIAADRKRVALETRVDELEKFVNTTNRSLSVKKLRDRLSELKAQQEEV